MRLWLRLTLAMAVVSLLPLIFTGALSLRAATQTAESTIQENQQISARLQSELVRVWVNSQVEALKGWREVYAGRVQTLEPRLQSGFLQAVYRATEPVLVAALVDRDGAMVVDPVYSNPGQSPRSAGSDQRAELLVNLAPLRELDGDRPFALGELYVPEPGGPPSVPVSVLIADGPPGRDGRTGWLALVAELSLEEVAESLGQLVGEQRGMALLDGSGVPRFGGEHPLIRPDLIRPLAGNVSTFTYDLADGRDVHGETAPVAFGEGSIWTVVVVQPASIVFASAESIRRTLQGTVAFSFVLAIGLGLSLAQTVAAPLAQLRDSVLQVASGRLGQQVPTGGGGELTELARAFNHMSTQLAHVQSEVEEKQGRIEAFNRELQDRVDERTAELREAQGELVRSGQLAAVAEVGAGLAHELNNPLAGILGLTQVLRARNAEGLDASLLADLESQAQRCREVVEAMQRFADADVDLSSAGVVDLRVVLSEVEALVSGPFRQRGVDLHLSRPERAITVGLDPVQGVRLLAQILQTLRAGLSEGTTLSVSARLQDDVARVSFVTDREAGVSLSRADDQRAAGLGLWVARQLAVRHGGALDEEHTDVGSSWVLELPVVEREA